MVTVIASIPVDGVQNSFSPCAACSSKFLEAAELVIHIGTAGGAGQRSRRQLAGRSSQARVGRVGFRRLWWDEPNGGIAFRIQAFLDAFAIQHERVIIEEERDTRTSGTFGELVSSGGGKQARVGDPRC